MILICYFCDWAMKRKITEFEYWPYKLLYAPFVPYWIWNSIKAGSFSYFCRANPGIRFGGFLDYSKSEILAQVPDEFKAETKFLKHKNDLTELPDFPFIVKPDLGERGVNVELIADKKNWENYKIKENLIIQEYIGLPYEFGIFYVKISGQSVILSITGKEFLKFRSDGKASLKNFVISNPRCVHRVDYLSNKFKDDWEKIHPKGKEILLEPIGNHNRGTRFFDASNLISEELIKNIEKIASAIKGFNYGRMDVKSESPEALKKGKFKILEVNGSNSEPTHIYDSNYSLWKAYGEIKRHLDIQYEISKNNPKTYSAKDFYSAVLKRLF